MPLFAMSICCAPWSLRISFSTVIFPWSPSAALPAFTLARCWAYLRNAGSYDCLEVVSDGGLDVEGLTIVFDGSHVLNLGRGD